MTGLVFVDTNVLLYAVDTRQPAKHAVAREWMLGLWRDRTGRISVQVLSEFYANATRVQSPGLSPDQAWEHMAALADWRPQAIDFAVLELGRQVQSRHGLSWWDSLIVAAANRQNCVVLLTEALPHGCVHAGVTAHNPFIAGIQESRARYAPTIEPRTMRGRGRPRKVEPVT